MIFLWEGDLCTKPLDKLRPRLQPRLRFEKEYMGKGPTNCHTTLVRDVALLPAIMQDKQLADKLFGPTPS